MKKYDENNKQHEHDKKYKDELIDIKNFINAYIDVIKSKENAKDEYDHIEPLTKEDIKNLIIIEEIYGIVLPFILGVLFLIGSIISFCLYIIYGTSALYAAFILLALSMGNIAPLMIGFVVNSAILIARKYASRYDEEEKRIAAEKTKESEAPVINKTDESKLTYGVVDFDNDHEEEEKKR